MGKALAITLLGGLAIIAVQADAQTGRTHRYPLDSVQGGWWSDCGDPAVAFLIEGDEYSGDFAGRYKIKLTGDTLVFNDGLIDGHSTNVAHRPLSFQILKANDSQLVLRPLPGNPHVGDWFLRSCKRMPSKK